MATRSWIFPTPSRTDVDEVSELRIEVMAGAIEVLPHEHAHTHIALEDVVGQPVQMTLSGGKLLVSHAPSGVEGLVRRLLPSRASGRVRLLIYVPTGVSVSVSGGSSEVSVAKVAEDLDLSTTSGRIHALECRGALHARTRSGDIVVRRHEGDANLTTATGRSDVQGNMPVGDFSTGTGDVWIVNTAPSHRTHVASLAGAVNLRVVSGAELRLKALRLSGHATVNGSVVDLSGGQVHVEGSGPDVADIQVSMVTGGLSVRRDAEQR